MKTACLVLGILTVVLSAVAGFAVLFTDFLAGVLCFVSGAVGALPYFALVALFGRVETLEWRLAGGGAPEKVPPLPEAPTSGSVKDALDW